MTTTDMVSRDPADYRPTTHFVQRKKERKIPGFAIRECIENGEIRDGKRPNLKILTTGYYALVIDVETRDVVTATVGAMS